jgi:CheY-like chemotaxis protein
MSEPSIAVVHTDPSVASLLMNLLEDEGYRPIAYNDPKNAFERIRHSIPALAIIDLGFGVSVPTWDLVDRLRTDPVTEHIPIIALTTSPDLEAVRPERCRENCELLSEPFDVNNLLGLLRSMINRPHNYRCG